MEEKNCYLMGAGALCKAEFIPRSGDLVIAVDGGYRPLVERGIAIDLVVGDFDSLAERPDHPNVVLLKKEKNDTDMLAALRIGRARGFQNFHLYGGTGGRVEHTLANVQCLAWLSRQGARGYLYGDGWILTSVTNGTISFHEAHRGFLSVLCHGDRAEGVTLRGLKYPLVNAVLTDDFPLGVSNEFTGIESSITVEKGTVDVIWYGECI